MYMVKNNVSNCEDVVRFKRMLEKCVLILVSEIILMMIFV